MFVDHLVKYLVSFIKKRLFQLTIFRFYIKLKLYMKSFQTFCANDAKHCEAESTNKSISLEINK